MYVHILNLILGCWCKEGFGFREEERLVLRQTERKIDIKQRQQSRGRDKRHQRTQVLVHLRGSFSRRAFVAQTDPSRCSERVDGSGTLSELSALF